MFPVRGDAAVGAFYSAPAALAQASLERTTRPRVELGLLTYSFAIAQRIGSEVPGTPDYADPAVFIVEAAGIGANAVQIPFKVLDRNESAKLRRLSEELSVALESTIALPQSDSDLPNFEAELRTLHNRGVTIARTVILPGRRYEEFASYAEYKAALNAARARLRRAEPFARRHQVRLAIENHKDQRIEERLRLLAEFDSEYLGACIDVGNNIALLENPLAVVNAFLPWALTVHFKDQAVRECADGFLLADIPLGQGCIDLQKVVRTIVAKRPKVRFHLELITRDALPVPVLADRYWRTFPEIRASELSQTLAVVKERGYREAFPVISALPPAERVSAERKNVEESFRFAARQLNFSL